MDINKKWLWQKKNMSNCQFFIVTLSEVVLVCSYLYNRHITFTVMKTKLFTISICKNTSTYQPQEMCFPRYEYKSQRYENPDKEDSYQDTWWLTGLKLKAYLEQLFLNRGLSCKHKQHFREKPALKCLPALCS